MKNWLMIALIFFSPAGQMIPTINPMAVQTVTPTENGVVLHLVGNEDVVVQGELDEVRVSLALAWYEFVEDYGLMVHAQDIRGDR